MPVRLVAGRGHDFSGFLSKPYEHRLQTGAGIKGLEREKGAG